MKRQFEKDFLKIPSLREVVFCSRAEAKNYVPEYCDGLISIFDPKEGSIPAHPNWRYFYRLECHDIDPPSNGIIPEVDGEKAVLFDNNKALDLMAFLLGSVRDDKLTRLIIHCHAGISRSAAIAKFISEVNDLPFLECYMLYNKHMYKTMRTLYYKKLGFTTYENDNIK